MVCGPRRPHRSCSHHEPVDGETSSGIGFIYSRSIDRATLHRERCSEVPSSHVYKDFWEGGWFDYPDKDRALTAMEQAGVTLKKLHLVQTVAQC